MVTRLKPEILRSIKWSGYIPHSPTGPQLAFLILPHREAMYGGAAGGGKSDALLMSALQYVDHPGYAAMLFRRRFSDLALEGALIPRSHEWLAPTDAHWNERDKKWTFPSGATLSFGYLEHENDKYRYQSSEFQFIGFDELTQFTESQYRYLFSRLRRRTGTDIPLRMRSASNPGGIGHDWVKRRFLEEGLQEGRVFIRAKLDDNPHIDRAEYISSLIQLDPITREQLLNGDWEIHPIGALFQRGWFEVISARPAAAIWVRYWDLAATEVKEGQDPDWTVGALVGIRDGVWYIGDIRRIRGTPGQVEALIKQTAILDGRGVTVLMEQEPGASGKTTIDNYARRVLPGFAFYGIRSTGSKIERARPVSSAAEAGNIKLVNGKWIGEFLDEAESFPISGHDDQIDAVSGAVGALLVPGEPEVMVYDERVAISPY